MALLTILMMLGMAALLVVRIFDALARHFRPELAFRGVNRLRSLVVPRRDMPDPEHGEEIVSTPSCDYLVLPPRLILFVARGWPFRGRIVANGSSWFIETRAPLHLWIWTVFLILLLLVVSEAVFRADGLVSGAVILGIGALGSLFYWRWFRGELARTRTLSEEIALALQEDAMERDEAR